MDWVDYLTFVQVGVVSNFGALLWSRKSGTDVMDNLVRQENRDYLTQTIAAVTKDIDDWELERQRLHEEKDLKAYYGQFNKFTKFFLAYNAVAMRLKCKTTSSYFFNMVCVVVGLFGMMQLYLLPDVGVDDYWTDVYMFAVEILLVLLFVTLLAEVLCRFCFDREEGYRCFKRSVALFLLVLGSACLWEELVADGIIPLGRLWISEEAFFRCSLFVPCLPFLIYFLLLFCDSVRDWWRAKKVVRLKNKWEKSRNGHETNLLRHKIRLICSRFQNKICSFAGTKQK